MNRLEEISKFIEKDSVIVDIGSDHGKLIKYLFDIKKIYKAYATEINYGPYLNCKNNTNEIDVEVFHTDGLINFERNVDAAIISGLGSNSMINIIDSSINKFKKMKYFVIQPMNKLQNIRRFLFENSFSIIREATILDNFYYNIMLVINKKQKEYDFILGMENNDYPLNYISYLKLERNKNVNILRGIKDHSKRKYFTDILDRIDSRIKNIEKNLYI